MTRLLHVLWWLVPMPRAVRYRLSTAARRAACHVYPFVGSCPTFDPEAASRRPGGPNGGGPVQSIRFRCNVCNTLNSDWPITALERDIPSCRGCGSAVRMRTVVHLLSLALYGRSIPLPDWPVRLEIKGAGLSDWSTYARWLEIKTSYVNTFFHRDPRLDICAPPATYDGTLDYLISTEVFEHVPPPASRAFEGAARMLKPGGTLILTVPFSNEAETVEHFPNLNDFKIEERGGRHVLVNRKKDSGIEEFDDLVFHGGPGTTLEMRLFCRDDLVRQLEAAGFADIKVHDEPVLESGIIHWDPWSLPITARKSRGR
jgi:SAM-dependent methyltransferase